MGGGGGHTVCVKPADDNRHSAVGSHCREEESSVLGVDVIVDCQEDGEAGDSDANWY